MSAGRSASSWAAQARAEARGTVWRRLRIRLGVPSAASRRAEAAAVRRERGAEGERATAALLDQLAARGWALRHDLQVPGRKFNVDHLAISPCGTAMVLPDSKAWRRNWPTHLVRGRLRCGPEDRHDQAEDLAGYARAVAAAVGLPAAAVWPVLVVHGSRVAGGWLKAPVRADGGGRAEVFVFSPAWLVPTLAGAPKARDPRRAAGLTARVDQVLRSYGS